MRAISTVSWWIIWRKIGDRVVVLAVVLAEFELDRTIVEVHEGGGAEQSSPSGFQDIPSSDR
jgi:hypothetical protein